MLYERQVDGRREGNLLVLTQRVYTVDETTQERYVLSESRWVIPITKPARILDFKPKSSVSGESNY